MLKKAFFIILIISLSIPAYCKLNLLIPLYSCPSDQNGKIWNTLITASKNYNINIIWGIICKEDNYKDILLKLKKRGIKNFAYISTNNSSRVLSKIKEKIDFYSKFPINGFFFDEINNKKKYNKYNKTIIKYVKSKNPFSKVILNSPYPDKYFLKNIPADIFVIYENSFNELKTLNLKEYNNFNLKKTAVLIHQTKYRDFKKAINFIIKNKIGYFFITNRNWDSLPTYFPYNLKF